MVMDPTTARHSWIFAALEILPGDPRDLSYLLTAAADNPGSLLAGEFDGPGYDGELAQHITRELDRGRIEHWYKKIDRYLADEPGAQIVDVLDPAYPRNLVACFDRPPVLSVMGELSPHDSRSVALVGGRRPSSAGLAAAHELAAAAAADGICVVSGLAEGIDTAAHEGALDGDGRTLAVLGSGIDRIQPESNKGLAEVIRREGALISQFPLGSPGTRTTFPMRNSVIAGLARVSVLVEALPNSGSFNEIGHALRHGRSIGLYRPLMTHVEGVEQLLELDNVHYVDGPDDIRKLVADASAATDTR